MASLSGATARSAFAYTAPAAPPRPENAQPCAVNTVRTPVRASARRASTPAFEELICTTSGASGAGQRAQLAHGGGVVVRMRVAHEVAHVMERHVERGAGVDERPAGPVRRDLDVVAVAQPGHERGREGLRSARLGERHDHEQTAASRREVLDAPRAAAGRRCVRRAGEARAEQPQRIGALDDRAAQLVVGERRLVGAELAGHRRARTRTRARARPRAGSSSRPGSRRSGPCARARARRSPSTPGSRGRRPRARAS